MVCDVCRAAGENARAARMVDFEDQSFVMSTESGVELSILVGNLLSELATVLHAACSGQCDCQHRTDIGVNT